MYTNKTGRVSIEQEEYLGLLEIGLAALTLIEKIKADHPGEELYVPEVIQLNKVVVARYGEDGSAPPKHSPPEDVPNE